MGCRVYHGPLESSRKHDPTIDRIPEGVTVYQFYFTPSKILPATQTGLRIVLGLIDILGGKTAVIGLCSDYYWYAKKCDK